MPIEIKLEETYILKKGEKKNRDKMLLSFYKKGKIR
jgi:hypothetical protein